MYDIFSGVDLRTWSSQQVVLYAGWNYVKELLGKERSATEMQKSLQNSIHQFKLLSKDVAELDPREDLLQYWFCIPDCIQSHEKVMLVLPDIEWADRCFCHRKAYGQFFKFYQNLCFFEILKNTIFWNKAI